MTMVDGIECSDRWRSKLRRAGFKGVGGDI